MEHYEIISMDKIREEKFNALVLETSGISQFLAYYTLLLKTACEYGFLTAFDAEDISNKILNSFQTLFEESVIVMSNNMYVLTSYLKTMTNIEQLEILKKITDKNQAKIIFEESSRWAFDQINKMERQLSFIRNSGLVSYDPRFAFACKEIILKVVELKTYSNVYTTFNFKQVHEAKMFAVSYCFAKNFNVENYFENVSLGIDLFLMELQIMKKLGAPEIIGNLKHRESTEKMLAENKIRQEKKKIENKLKNLEIAYQNIKQAEWEYQQAIIKLEEEFKATYIKEHSKTFDEDEFFDAFEEWLLTLPKERFNNDGAHIDIQVISMKYKEKKEELLTKLDKFEKTSEKRLKDNWSVFSEEVYLEEIVKIKAVMIMAEYETIQIPQDIKKLKEFISKIKIADAVKVLLMNPDMKDLFDEKEITYLRTL